MRGFWAVLLVGGVGVWFVSWAGTIAYAECSNEKPYRQRDSLTSEESHFPHVVAFWASSDSVGAMRHQEVTERDSGSEAQATSIHPDQVVVFSATYQNFAWAHISRGYYIDRIGNVMGWSMSPERPLWSPRHDSLYTLDQLLRGFPMAVDTILRIDQTDLTRMFALALQCENSHVSKRDEGWAPDMGTTHFNVYLYDSISQKYKSIILHVTGDQMKYSDAPVADTLWRWLYEVGKDGHMELPTRKK